MSQGSSVAAQPVTPLRIKVQYNGGRLIYTLVDKNIYRLMARKRPVYQPESARKWKRFFIEDILGQPKVEQADDSGECSVKRARQ